MRVGFIGLGNIGAPMARRMVSAFGADASVFDAMPAALSGFEKEAALAASPAAMGGNVEIVGVCVRDDADVHAVVDGESGLLRTMRDGVIAIHSTVRPSTVRDLAQIAAKQGVALIDAAVSGGPDGAGKGALTAMVGGDPAALERARPMIASYCSDIIHAGATGAGMALKLCNNLVTYMELSAAVEAYRLADALGLDHEQLSAVMTNNGNLTPSMRQYIGFRRSGAEMLGKDAFLATQDGLVILGEKDLALALEAAAESGIAIPITEQVRTRFERVIMEGLKS